MKKALRLRSLASSKGGSPRSGGCGGAKSAPPRWPATVGELTRVQMRISEPAATSSRRPRARHIAQGRAARAAPADAVPDVVELSVAKNMFKAFDLGGHQIARLFYEKNAKLRGEKDDKIIAVCADDPEYCHYNDIGELSPHCLQEF
uniref:Uncharacterized protein n=1 Tax=Oryza barthii TaxID=65489 RepID=A0A0D3G5H0_9ORYZ